MKHCFHGTGSVLTSYPPQYPEICCYCGKRRNRTYRVIKVTTSHGRYAPQGMLSTLGPDEKVQVLPFEDEECTETSPYLRG